MAVCDNALHYITKQSTVHRLASVNERTNKRTGRFLSWFRKTARVGADVTTWCRLFQRRHPATGKVRAQ